MSKLVKYDAALRAVAECKAVDEVKSWVDKAAAMQAYGKMAQDKTLEVDAAEIRIRAERRLGQMLAEQKATTGLAKSGPKPAADKHSVVTNDRIADDRTDRTNSVVTNDRIPTLAEVGISKDLSSRAQKLAAVPEPEFEAEVKGWREEVTQANKRVSARLQKAGERQLARQAEDAEPPSLEELMANDRAAEDELSALRRVMDADDKLAEAVSLIKQKDALIQQLQWRIDSLTTTNSELVAEVKRLQRKLA